MTNPVYLFGTRIDKEDDDSVAAPVVPPVPVPLNVIAPELMFTKKLEQSDIAPNQGRLLMSYCQNLLNFLTEEDKRENLNMIDGDQEEASSSSSSLSPPSSSSSSSSSSSMKRKKTKGVEVEMKDDQGRSFGLSLIYWPSVKKFVLNKGWNGVVKENDLQKGDVIEVLCCGRNHENRLCLHMKIVSQPRLQQS